jgi:hypothetical protein
VKKSGFDLTPIGRLNFRVLPTADGEVIENLIDLVVAVPPKPDLGLYVVR